MRGNSFDEFVKESLSGYRPEVPPHIWENIANGKDNKKPIGFWIALFGSARIAAGFAALLGAGLITWFAVKNNNTQKDVPGKTAATETNKINNAGPSTAAQNVADLSDFNAPVRQDRSGNALPLRAKISSGSRTDVFVEAPSSSLESSQITEGFMLQKQLLLLAAARMRQADARLQVSQVLKNRNIPCPEIEKDASGNKRYLEMYVSPDLNFNSYSDHVNPQYAAQRAASESRQFSYSAGARFTKVFRNGMSVRAGVNYSRVNELFKYEKGNVIHNVYITNAAGDTTGTYTQRGTEYQTGTNVYQSFDVPVTAGYELGNGRLHANINAGAVINIHSTQQGAVLNNNGSPVSISGNKNNSAYSRKTNTGVSLTGGVSVYYKLNDRFHVLAEPYMRYGITPVSKAEQSMKLKTGTAGLRVGLRMDLP